MPQLKRIFFQLPRQQLAQIQQQSEEPNGYGQVEVLLRFASLVELDGEQLDDVLRQMIAQVPDGLVLRRIVPFGVIEERFIALRVSFELHEVAPAADH